MKRLVYIMSVLLFSAVINAATTATITYQLNGGVTNDYGWMTKNDMFQACVADCGATGLGTLEEIKATGDPCVTIRTKLTDVSGMLSNAKWDWLEAYIMEVQNAYEGATALTEGTNSAAWCYAVAAFFVEGQRTGWPKSADFSQAGKVEAFMSAWKHAFANPTTTTSEFVLNTPYKEGDTFVGWYDNAAGTGTPITTIPAGYSGTLYAIWESTIPEGPSYTVAGAPEIVFGTDWDPTNTDNDMVKQADGTYKWEKTELELTATTVEFKICEDHGWDVSYPTTTYELAIPESGIYTITITFDPTTKTIDATATRTGGEVIIPTVVITGDMNDWSMTKDVFTMAADGLTASITLNLESKNYGFKMIIGETWFSDGATITRENNSVVFSGDNSMKNSTFSADIAGEYTFTWTYATRTLVATYPVISESSEPVYEENTLNPFAFDLSSALSNDTATLTVNYSLNNSRATSVNVVVYNGTKVVTTVPGTTTIGKNTVDIATANFPTGVKLTWAVVVNGTSVATPTQEAKLYNFYHPSTIAIDNNPENETFGLILANEAMHSVKDLTGYVSSGYGAGIYAFTPSFDPIPNGANPGYNGGIEFTKTRADGTGTAYAPRRIRISEDGRIFVTSLNTDGNYLWEVNPANMNEWTPVFQGTLNDNKELISAEGSFIAAPNNGFDVKGAGENLQLMMYSVNLPGITGAAMSGFRCDEYNLGTATSWATAPSKNWVLGKYAINYTGTQVVYDNEGGVWIAQYRGIASDSNPGLVHINASGVEDAKLVWNNVRNAGIRFNHDFTKLIVAGNNGTTKKATLYAISKSTSGAPVLTEELVIDMTILGNNISDFAFDYAGNLYSCSNSNEKLAAWTMPYSGKVETPAASKYAFTIGTAPKIEWIEMSLEITNLTTDQMQVGDQKFLQLSGRNDMDDADVLLFLNNYTGEEKAYEVNAENSLITFGSLELTVMDGSITKSVDSKWGDVYAGVVHAFVEEQGEVMYVAFELTMYYYDTAPIAIEIENVTIIVNEENAIATFAATWEGTPLSVEVSSFKETESAEYSECWLTIGDDVNWVDAATGSVAIVITNGIATLEGEFTSFSTGKSYSVVLSGTMPGKEESERKDLTGLRFYINPGHGSFGPNDRPMATIPYPNLPTTGMPDTCGFYESNTNLQTALYLGKKLEAAGATVQFSHTECGPWDYEKANGDYPDYTWAEYQKHPDIEKYNRDLAEICEEVEANNIDYFISIHSNSATDGSTINYPLMLYRGPDDYANANSTNGAEYVEGSYEKASACYSERRKIMTAGIDVTSNSNTFIRGDRSYYGTSTNSTINGKTYTGYMGVLKHGASGFCSEGYFHTYQPARHRALNDDYCHMEGLDYYRGIINYYGADKETVGYIVGTIKDKNNKMNHSLFKYADNTNDQWVPCNGAEVILKKGGKEVKRYKVDNNYNGLFIFKDLEPGNDYSLDATCDGYQALAAEYKGTFSVKANETTYSMIYLEEGTNTTPGITYQLNGGVTNDYGWMTKNDMFQACMADCGATGLGTLEEIKATSDPCSTIRTKLTEVSGMLSNAKWDWLEAYIMEVQNADVTAIQLEAGVTSPAWCYAVAAFFVEGQRTGWPQSADFSQAGKVEAFMPAWKHAFANPTNPTSEFVLNAPYKEGHLFNGWYKNASFTGTNVTSVNASTTGTLYAKWIEYIPTIAEVHAMADNTETKVSGVVNFISVKSVYIQDATGGMLVYTTTTPSCNVGDKIIVKGVRTTYGGAPEVKSAVIESVTTAALSEPIVLSSLAELVNDTQFRYFGSRVKLYGLTIESYDAFNNPTLTDGTHSAICYKMVLDPTVYPVGKKVNITAVAGWYNGFRFVGDPAGIEFVTTGAKDTYSYPVRENKYTLTNNWIFSNTKGNFVDNKPGAASGSVRGMAAYNGKMYFINRETASLTVVDGATGEMLDSIMITGEHLFEKQGEDGTWSVGCTFGYNDIHFDDAGNCLIGGLVTSPQQNFYIYKVDLATGKATEVINECLADNTDMAGLNVRFDAFGVAGDITKNGVIMAASSSDGWDVCRWIITNGNAGQSELFQLDPPSASSSLFSDATSLGTCARILPQDEGGTLFYVDGFNTLPMLFSEDGWVVDDFINCPTGTTVTNKTGDAITMNTGHNGVIEFRVGDEYFLLLAATNTAHTVPSSFALYKFKDAYRAFSDMEPLWYFPAEGMGNALNITRTAIPAVEVVGNKAIIYLYGAENGYASYTLDVKSGSSSPETVNEYATICHGETYSWNGKEYFASGNYTYTSGNTTYVLHLTVLPSPTQETSNIILQEDQLPYTWQGQTITESGVYTHTEYDEYDCERVIHTLYVTVNAAGVNNQCGDDLYWSYSNGTLIISGTGRMYDDPLLQSYRNNTWFPGQVQQVVLSTSLTHIGKVAFADCSKLRQISIPSSVNSIGDGAFAYSGLESITLPSMLTSMGEQVFVGCQSLTSFYATDADGLTSNSLPFLGCNNLQTVETSAAVWHCEASDPIAEQYYGVPKAINHLVITDGELTAKAIGYIHQSHQSLKYMDLSKVDNTAIDAEAFSNYHHLENLVLPNNLQRINKAAFKNAYSLTVLKLPEYVNHIQSEAFANCYHLTKIYVDAYTPPYVENSNAFEAVNRYIPVYVPEAVVEQYKNADVWKEFYILPNTIDDVDNILINQQQDVQKVMINNQVVIIRNGHVYSILGHEIK